MPHKMPVYPCSVSNRPLSADEICKTNKRTIKINIMRDWFNYHFGDPDDHALRIEGDDGYFYIHGGPFAPYDVLTEEFNAIVPKKIIGDLANELRKIRTEWAPISGRNYHRDIEANDPLQEFTETIGNIKKLLSASDNIPPDVVSSMHRLLYANIITAIEVYLSGAFEDEIIYQKNLISNLLKSIAYIKNRYDNYNENIIWHKLRDVQKMYKKAFGIKFHENVEMIQRAVLVRHDIIHRNGCTKHGKYHKINKTEIEDLIKEAKIFTHHIDNKILAQILNPTTK